MFLPPFIINGRILVDPELGQLTDIRLQTRILLERRVMKLLCLLVRNRGKFVSGRKIKEELNDFYETTSAELQLTITDLRKKLEDAGESLIKAVPENGYMIEAVITDASGSIPAGGGRRQSFHTVQKYSWLVIIACLLGIILFLFFNQGKAPNPDTLPEPGVVAPVSHDTTPVADTTMKGKE